MVKAHTRTPSASSEYANDGAGADCGTLRPILDARIARTLSMTGYRCRLTTAFVDLTARFSMVTRPASSPALCAGENRLSAAGQLQRL